MYGLFGANFGYLPCKAVAASTTAIGRAMIQKTKEVVEARGARVVYGDTDSVFITWDPDTTLSQAFAMGPEYAAEVTTHFRAPVKLEFEKARPQTTACYPP